MWFTLKKNLNHFLLEYFYKSSVIGVIGKAEVLQRLKYEPH